MKILPGQLLKDKRCCVCQFPYTPKVIEYQGEDDNVYVVCADKHLGALYGYRTVGIPTDCREKFCMFPFTWTPDTELTNLATTIRKGLGDDVHATRKAIGYIKDNACCPVNIPKHYTPKQQLKRLKQLEKKMKSLNYTGKRVGK